MVKKIAIILLSLFFLGEIPIEDSENSEAEFYAFVNNPNGIQLYSKVGDFKSKTKSMRYQDEFGLYGSNEDINGKSWRRVKFQKKDYYISDPDGYLQFENGVSENYALVQEKSLILYEKPFKDARVIGKLEQFSIVNPVSLFRFHDEYMGRFEMEGSLNQFNTWHKIITSQQLTGFILNGIGEIYTLETMEENKSKKALNVKGVCEIISTASDFYSDEILKEQADDKTKEIFQKEKFLPTDYSFEKNKIRYYSINLTVYTKKTPMELDKTDKNPFRNKRIKKYSIENYVAFISEKQCKFYSEREYSDYTASNSQFTGDKKAIFAMKQIFDRNNFYLDYTHFKLIPLNPESSKFDSYFVAVLPVSDKNDDGKYEKAILLRKSKYDFQAVSHSLYPDIKLVDIDKDGISELLVGVPMRADLSDNELYIFQKGKYININTILPKNEQFNAFHDNAILAGKSIYDKDGQYESYEQVRYKYFKGKLIKIK